MSYQFLRRSRNSFELPEENFISEERCKKMTSNEADRGIPLPFLVTSEFTHSYGCKRGAANTVLTYGDGNNKSETTSMIMRLKVP